MALYVGSQRVAPVLRTGSGGGGVTDVEVNGTSVVSGGVANVTTAGVLPSQTGNANKVLTTNGTTASWGDLSTRNIGEIVTSTIPLTDAGLHLLDGALIQHSSYGAFVDYIGDLYTENPNASYFAKTETDWVQPVLSSNGTLGGNSFAVSADSVYSSTYETYLAFDNSDSTQWLTQAPASITFPTALILYNPVALKCSKLTMTNRLTYNSIFTGGNVYGSDDNSTWNLITAFTNNVTTAGAQWEINLSSNNNFCKYYKIEFTSGVIDSGTSTASYGFTEVKMSATYQITAEEWWQRQVSTYGVCGKFVYDSVNNTVRLPKITGIVEGTASLTALGDLVQAGLPNITGDYQARGVGTLNSSSGALYSSASASMSYASHNSTSADIPNIAIDASRSSSIYGNSTTVQPQSIKVLYYIVVATTTKTDIEVDIDEIATDLNGKADVDGSNMVNSVKNFDGGWVYSYSQLASSVAISTSADQTYSLSSYLPNDGYNYEVLVGANISVSTNSKFCNIYATTDLITNGVGIVGGSKSGTSYNFYNCGSAVMPVGLGRKITILKGSSSGAEGTYTLSAFGYRRIGTNS